MAAGSGSRSGSGFSEFDSNAIVNASEADAFVAKLSTASGEERRKQSTIPHGAAIRMFFLQFQSKKTSQHDRAWEELSHEPEETKMSYLSREA